MLLQDPCGNLHKQGVKVTFLEEIIEMGRTILVRNQSNILIFQT